MKNFTKVGLGLSLVLSSRLCADIADDFTIDKDTNLMDYYGTGYEPSDKKLTISKPKKQKIVYVNQPDSGDSKVQSIIVNNLYLPKYTALAEGNEFTITGGTGVNKVNVGYIVDGESIDSHANTLNLHGGAMSAVIDPASAGDTYIAPQAYTLLLEAIRKAKADNNTVNIGYKEDGELKGNFRFEKTSFQGSGNIHHANIAAVMLADPDSVEGIFSKNVVNIYNAGDLQGEIYAVNLHVGDGATANGNVINLHAINKNWRELALIVAGGNLRLDKPLQAIH